MTALDVPAGAVLVAKANRPLTVEQAEAIQRHISEAVPGHKVFVLPHGVELDVLRTGS